MATLLIAAVASSAGWGAVTTAVATAAAGYIDSRFVMPMLFPPPDQGAPSIGDLHFQFAEEGSPVTYFLGNECRGTGALIWQGPVVIDEIEEDTGGCGGSSSVVVGHRKSLNCCIAVCEAPPEGVHKFRRIWADGILLYDSDPDITVSTTLVRVARFEVWTTILDPNGGPPRQLLSDVFMDIISPAGAEDLTQFVSGQGVVITGFTNGGNNGTFGVISTSGTSIPGESSVRFRNAACVTEAASGGGKVLFQDLPNFSPKKMAGLTFYDGSAGQIADPLMVAAEGLDVPADRGIAKVVFEGLVISEYGDRIPEMSFEIQTDDVDLDLSEAVSRLMIRGGFDSTEFEVGDVTGTLRGTSIRGPQPITHSLQPLGVVFDLVAQQRNGRVAFFRRDVSPELDVPAAKLGASPYGGTPAERITIQDTEEDGLPDEVSVRYPDPSFFLQSGSQSQRKNKDGPREVARVEVPVTLSGDEARGLARRLLWRAWAERHQISFSLPPSMLGIREGDVAIFTVEGETYRVMCRSVYLRTDGVIECEGLIDLPSLALISTGPFEEPVGTTGAVGLKVALPGVMVLDVRDLPPFLSQHVNEVGYYFAVAMADSKVVLEGGYIYESTDGVVFTQGPQILNEVKMGVVFSVLADRTFPYFDDISSVTVRLTHGSLASATEHQVLSGMNRAMVGAEMVGFKTATLTAPDTYLLSGLLRGLGDTQAATSTHIVGEQFILLNSMTLSNFAQLPSSALGSTRYYKAVANGVSSASVVTSFPLDHSGATLRHFAPAHIVMRRTVSTGDLLLTWARRSRGPVRIFQPGTLPLYDIVEKYEIEFWSANFVSLTHTAFVTGSSTLTLTSAQQTTIFGSPQTTLHVRVYQIHSQVGRSRKLQAASLIATEHA